MMVNMNIQKDMLLLQKIRLPSVDIYKKLEVAECFSSTMKFMYTF